MMKAREFSSKSCELFENTRKDYEVISSKIVEGLATLLEPLNESVAFVTGRVKGTKSLKEKIIRKNYHLKFDNPDAFVSGLSDGIGIRIVTLLKVDEEKIYNYLLNRSNGAHLTHDGKLYENIMDHFYIFRDEQPQDQQNGLPIYRIDFVWENVETAKIVKGELQIKSLAHLLWGEIEHALFYKNSNYIISGSYYSTLMKSIYNGLENIDCQIEALQSHMNDKVKNSDDEIHQIAGLLLSQKYKNDLNRILECDLDLVEVYKAISEMYFIRVMAADDNLYQLKLLQENIADSLDIQQAFDVLCRGRYDESEISKKNTPLARCIDENIKKEDAFWTSFCAIHISLNDRQGKQEKSYSEWLSSIASNLIGLFKSAIDSIDSFDDEINQLLSSIMMGALIKVIITVNKISLFTDMGGKRAILDELERTIRIVQNKIIRYGGHDYSVYSEIIESNKLTIQNYIIWHLLLASGEKLSEALCQEMTKQANEINDFNLNFSYDILAEKKAEETDSKEVAEVSLGGDI